MPCLRRPGSSQEPGGRLAARAGQLGPGGEDGIEGDLAAALALAKDAERARVAVDELEPRVAVRRDRQADGDLNETGETPLLGLLSGHYGLERSDPKKNPAMALYRPDELNMGIARVTPWGDVMKILNGDKLTRMRAERDAQAPSQQVVLDDIIARKIPGVEVTKLTKAEFEAALRKVSRRLVPKKNGG